MLRSCKAVNQGMLDEQTAGYVAGYIINEESVIDKLIAAEVMA
ncbi:hypothetical protein [Shewanella gelidimarina]|nr:hypothetical protein [Shewanella gelidimarina]